MLAAPLDPPAENGRELAADGIQKILRLLKGLTSDGNDAFVSLGKTLCESGTVRALPSDRAHPH